MLYGQELIEKLQKDIENTIAVMENRQKRIDDWQTDEDDCFLSIRIDERALQLYKDKIRLIEEGGTAWFREYATLDGQLVKAHWCNTAYGSSLRAELPDGTVVWTSSRTKTGLAKKGLKAVECRRPAWYCYKTPYKGLYGAYCGSYELFPADFNYATGESAGEAPLEIRETA